MNSRLVEELQPQVELIMAARIGNLEGAIAAIKSGANPNEPLPDADMQLHPAYDLTKDDRVSSALQIAIRYGHVDLVKMLLQADLTQTALAVNGETPLITAVKANNEDIVHLLLERETNINAADSDGKTAFMIALLAGNLRIREILLQRGESSHKIVEHAFDVSVEKLIKLASSARNSNQDSEMESICLNLMLRLDKHPEALYNLLKKNDRFLNCISTTKDRNTCRALMELIDFLDSHSDLPLEELFPKKYTFANYYLKENIYSMIQNLPIEERIKRYNAILNDPKNIGYHIFHMKRDYILSVNEKRGMLHDIAQALQGDREALQKQSDAKASRQVELNRDLIAASAKGDVDKMWLLISQGADVNYIDSEHKREHADMESALATAAYNGRKDAVELLVRNNADVNRTLKYGRHKGVTPLFISAQLNHRDILNQLLAKGANPELARELDDGKPMMIAVSLKNIDIVKSLLEYSAKIDVFANEEIYFTSPLRLAIFKKSHEILEILIQHMIENYDIPRIVTFLQTHDNLKKCFAGADNNEPLIAALDKLVAHLVKNGVEESVLQAMLPEGKAIPEEKTAVINTVLYPALPQEAARMPDALQAYIDKGKLLRELAEIQAEMKTEAQAEPALNPFTNELLPVTPAREFPADPLAAIDGIVTAPPLTYYERQLSVIDFSQTTPAIPVAVQPMKDLISFDEPVKQHDKSLDETPAVEKAAQPASTKQHDVRLFAQKASETTSNNNRKKATPA